MLLKGKVVLVTGGGRGIGACIARVLAKEGATVAINCCQSRDKAETLAESLCRDGGIAKVWQCDVRNSTDVTRMVEEIYNEFGRLDAVVNNAISGMQFGKIDNTDWDDYATALDYGAKAVINTVKAACTVMKEQGGGRIVNIVTEVWNLAPGGWSVYMAGKGAMVGISRSLAAELGSENITVNMVAPGWMRDEKCENINTEDYLRGIPMGRQGEAEEIGKVCAFLISDLAAFVTGAYIPVCGGSVRQMGG